MSESKLLHLTTEGETYTQTASNKAGLGGYDRGQIDDEKAKRLKTFIIRQQNIVFNKMMGNLILKSEREESQEEWQAFLQQQEEQWTREKNIIIGNTQIEKDDKQTEKQPVSTDSTSLGFLSLEGWSNEMNDIIDSDSELDYGDMEDEKREALKEQLKGEFTKEKILGGFMQATEVAKKIKNKEQTIEKHKTQVTERFKNRDPTPTLTQTDIFNTLLEKIDNLVKDRKEELSTRQGDGSEGEEIDAAADYARNLIAAYMLETTERILENTTRAFDIESKNGRIKLCNFHSSLNSKMLNMYIENLDLKHQRTQITTRLLGPG